MHLLGFRLLVPDGWWRDPCWLMTPVLVAPRPPEGKRKPVTGAVDVPRNRAVEAGVWGDGASNPPRTTPRQGWALREGVWMTQ